MAWPNDPPPKRRRSSWAPTAAVIGALAVVAGALLLVPPLLSPPEASTPPTTAPSAAPSSEISPYRSVAWRIVPFADVPADARIRLNVIGDRLIATDAGGTTFRAWFSDDGGETWSMASVPPLAPPAEGAVAHFGAVAGDGNRAVAAGGWFDASQGQPLGSLLLVSDDRGGSWRSVPVPPLLTNGDFTILLGTGNGFLAYGRDFLRNTSGWWESADGITWGPALVSGLSTFDPPVSAVAGPAGLVAVGATGAGRTTRPAAWFSEDGHDWELTLDEPAPFGQVERATAGPGGYAISGTSWTDVGSDPASDLAAMWRSPDGRRWTTSTVTDADGWKVGDLATALSGTVAMIYRPSGIPGGAAELQAVFLPWGSEATSTVDLPLAAPMVGIGDRFVGVGRCAPDAGCSGTYLLFGKPSDDLEAPAPTIPER